MRLDAEPLILRYLWTHELSGTETAVPFRPSSQRTHDFIQQRNQFRAKAKSLVLLLKRNIFLTRHLMLLNGRDDRFIYYGYEFFSKCSLYSRERLGHNFMYNSVIDFILFDSPCVTKSHLIPVPVPAL